MVERSENESFQLESVPSALEARRARKRRNAARWRAKNLEKARALNREYERRNPERAKVRSLKWYKENSDLAKNRSQEWRKQNPDQVKEVNAAWRRNNPDRVWQSKEIDWRKKGIKLTRASYNAMWEAQDGCCKLCGIHQSQLKKALHADHDHLTGRVRGLLCQKCNHALGLFKDNPNTIRRALLYLGAEK
jgi:hypothetical protein